MMATRQHYLSTDDACDLYLENDRLREENERLLALLRERAEVIPATALDESDWRDGD